MTSALRITRYLFSAGVVLFVLLIFINPSYSTYSFLMYMSLSITLFLQAIESYVGQKYPQGTNLLLVIAAMMCMLASTLLL